MIELPLGGLLRIDHLVKWAQISYGISYIMIFFSSVQFFRINRLLGPLTISLGYMLKDFYNFVYLLLTVMIPYGVIMQVKRNDFHVTPDAIVLIKVVSALWATVMGEKGVKKALWVEVLKSNVKKSNGGKTFYGG